MIQYDVKCPVCGKINKGLYLAETGGWMECECCGAIVEAAVFRDNNAIPNLTTEFCEEKMTRAVG